MLEIYVLVEKKKSMLMLFLNAFVLTLAIIALILSCLSLPFMILIALVLACAWYFLFLYSNQEYEYSYFDGDVRFARILNKSRRKNLKSYTMDEVIQIAPAGDRSVMKYENDPKVKKRNYTSRFQGVPYYEMVIRSSDDDGLVLIQFEPDEAYLNAVCMKYSQKVIRDPSGFGK